MRDVQRILRPLATKIANLVSRAVVRRVDDSTKMQSLQIDVLTEETRDGVERPQNYGFTAVPLAGAEAVVVYVGGSRAHGLAVAVDDRRHRLKGLQPGEVAIYTDQGDSVVIRRGGTIEVKAATKVKVDAPLVELAGNSDGAYKGTTHRNADATLSTAHTTFLAALGTYATAIKAVADPTNAATPALASAITAFSAAISTYESAAAAAVSTKVKLG